jgi:hypothetical protein
MNEKTKRGLEVVEAALLLGILGDALLRATPWGLNVTLWSGALALALLALLVRGRSKALSGEGRWLLLPLAFFSAGFAWRDSLTLQILDALGLAVIFSLIALRARGGWIRLAGLTEYVAGGFLAAFNGLFGAFGLLAADIQWKEVRVNGWSRHVIAILRGVALTVPLLFVFGALLMAADAVFEGLLKTSFQIDFDALFSHLLLLAFLAWTSAGFLRSAVLGKELPRTKGGQLDVSEFIQPVVYEPPTAQVEFKTLDGQSVPPPVKKKLSLGIVEIGIVLGTLNLLFLSFVIVQVRYFFGGARLVQISAGLTYAEYARSGFFELVWVAALVLPLLLAAHWLLRKENAAHERIFRLLAGLQVVLLFVIMTSAIGRMRLYQREYGLTELRLYTTAFMGWLALVFVWFAATVLRGRRERFACGALVTGCAIIAALHVLNPDDLIVRANVAHVQTVRALDVGYATSLSADAVPALVASLPALGRIERCRVASYLLYQRAELESADWRSWNLSRSEAASLLRQDFGELWEEACRSGSNGESAQSSNADRH